MSYESFLISKQKRAKLQGIEISPESLNPKLFPYQRAIVSRALRAKRFACFADTGMGKAFLELEFAYQVCLATGGNALILAPIAVTKQLAREASKFGYKVTLCASQADVRDGINITNYEKLHKFENDWACLVLDESSCIKGFQSAITRSLFEFGKDIPYRFCGTATPAPNDLIEITNHSEFLGILSGKEVIALYFTQDGNSTVEWRLKGHAKKPFYQWLGSWACAIRKPSDMGSFDDASHQLPPLEYHQHEVEVQKENLSTLFAMAAETLQEQRQAKRDSLKERVAKCAELVNNSEGYWVIWTELNQESQVITKAIPDAVELTGSQSESVKESILEKFSKGEIRVLVSKPAIAGFGLNWQHCHQIAFLGLTHSFEQQYQAIRRCWRYGQEKPVQVHYVTSNLEGKIVANVKRKETEFNEMMDNLVAEMKDFQAKNTFTRTEHKTGYKAGNGWDLYLGDCVEEIDNLKSESVDCIIFSPPFPTMYAYTDLEADMGNVESIERMIEHFKYLIPELNRVLLPGRMCCVHLCQLLATKGRDNYIGVKDYRGKVIEAFDSLNFPYAGEVCISKNPQIQATRNKERGLLFKSLATDSSVMRMALADYVLYFRKLGDNPKPIQAGMSKKYNPTGGWITEEEWIEWADPVWHRYNAITRTGIRETDVLNVRSARDNDDERHLCPLQLGVIERLVKLYTNPGETVLDPFNGIGSTGYKALELNRKYIGIELKESYFNTAIKNLSLAESVKSNQLDLFGVAAEA
jgi:superfamily II DNA or RNA helicase